MDQQDYNNDYDYPNDGVEGYDNPPADVMPMDDKLGSEQIPA